jgi:hypothetical protein
MGMGSSIRWAKGRWSRSIPFRDDQEGFVAKTFTRLGFVNLDNWTEYGFLQPWIVQLQFKTEFGQITNN